MVPFSQVKKKAAEKPKEYAELQAKYAKMQEMDMARYATVSATNPYSLIYSTFAKYLASRRGALRVFSPRGWRGGGLCCSACEMVGRKKLCFNQVLTP